MEKKSLSQQTADRLYTMIVVEHRLSPGEKLPVRWSWPGSWGSAAPPCGRPSMSWSPKKSWRPAGGRGTFVTDQAAQVNDYGFSHLDQVRGGAEGPL